jgi:hypothetical protein
MIVAITKVEIILLRSELRLDEILIIKKMNWIPNPNIKLPINCEKDIKDSFLSIISKITKKKIKVVKTINKLKIKIILGIIINCVQILIPTIT